MRMPCKSAVWIDEIRRRTAGAFDFRPDAGVSRLQRIVLQGRPIPPDRLVEAIGAAGIDM